MLAIPPPPLIKVAHNTRSYSKLGGKTSNGGRRKVSIISYGPVNTSDLKQEGSFFRGSVSTILQLVGASLLAVAKCIYYMYQLYERQL